MLSVQMSFPESQKMACYLKREAYSGPISFEVQRNDIWTTSSKYFELIVNLLVCNVIEREIERENGQMKPPTIL
jgi:hypothetical protein